MFCWNIEKIEKSNLYVDSHKKKNVHVYDVQSFDNLNSFYLGYVVVGS